MPKLGVVIASVREGRVGLSIAQWFVERARQHARFNVAAVDLKANEFVTAGSVAVRLADVSTWQIETTDLTELSVVRITQDAPVTISFDALPGVTLPGKVTRIEMIGENKQGDIAYTVHVLPERQDSHLRWNMTASVAIDAQ